MAQLIENREHWLGIQECLDLVMDLTPEQIAEYRDRIERSESKIDRWNIIREAFRGYVDACRAGKQFRLPDDGSGF